MKLLMSITFVLTTFTVAAMAYPQYSNEDVGGWKTWDAIKSFFRPVTNWFSEELPHKSPSDLVDDVQETAADVGNWAEESGIIEGVQNAVRPVANWVQDGVEYVKDKPIKVLYSDVKDSISNIDENVGGWIDRNVG